jgi:hypothetical protein
MLQESQPVNPVRTPVSRRQSGAGPYPVRAGHTGYQQYEPAEYADPSGPYPESASGAVVFTVES